MLLTDTNTNRVYFSAHIKDFSFYPTLLKELDKHQIEHKLLAHTKDYWVRDFMPIQITKNEFVQYQYQPDYLKKEKKYISNPQKCFEFLNLKPTPLDVILDGGNVIKCKNRIIMTNKVFTENINLSKLQLIHTLEHTFKTEISFIPWDKNEIYGHADGMVRYIGNNKIILNNYIDYDKTLRNKIIKVLKPHFDIIELHYPISSPSPRNWAYINFLHTANLILLPALQIYEDELALKQIHEAFPNHSIEQINVSEIIKLGGALNCISWNIKYK